MKLKANWCHYMALYEVEGREWYSEDGMEWFAKDGCDILDCQFFSSEITLYGGPEDGETVGLDLDEIYEASTWAVSDQLHIGDQLVLIEAARTGFGIAYRWATTDSQGQCKHGHPCLHLLDAVCSAQAMISDTYKEKGNQ
jgi:hypothetical protein